MAGQPKALVLQYYPAQLLVGSLQTLLTRVSNQQLLIGHEDVLYHATFSPDGTPVVNVSHDGTARVWPLIAVYHTALAPSLPPENTTLQQLLTQSCHWLRPDLTQSPDRAQ